VIPGRYALSVGKPDREPPPGWRWTLLTDIARLETGHTPSRKRPEYWDGDVPWIGIRDATAAHGFTLHDTVEHTNQLGIENSSARVLPANTVCLSRTASVGYVVVMGRPMATSQDFVNWVCSDDLDFRFLKYVLLAERDSFHMFASGSVHQTIYFPEVKAFHICLPPIKEQRRIADVLSALDDKIELNRRMNGTLESIARAIFKSWFVDFDPVRRKMEGGDPGLPPDLAALFPDAVSDSALGELPSGWRVGCLGDVAVQVRDSVKPSDILAATPYFGLEHLPKRSIALGDWTTADGVASGKSRFAVGDILFGKLRPYFHKVGPPPVAGVCSTDIVVVRPLASEYFALVLGHLSSDEFVDHANAASSGTRMPRTSWRDMAAYPIAVPPRAVCTAFEAMAGPLVDLTWGNITRSRTLSCLRDTALPVLLAGELALSTPEGDDAYAT